MLKLRRKTTYDQLLAEESLIVEATEEICQVMEEQELTRDELAKRLGVSPSHVTQMLSGERNMTLRTLARIGYALGVSPQVAMIP